MTETDENFFGCLRRIQTVFGPDAHTTGNGVHTFDVAQSPNVDSYLGFAGPVLGGAIDLWNSQDLDKWTPVTSDILPVDDARWATVLPGEDQLWLVVREKTYSRMPFIGSQQLTLFKTYDGQSFLQVESVVSQTDHDGMIANPFLFRDGEGVGLVYYEGGDHEWRIWVRTANLPNELPNGKQRLLADWTEQVLAAPSIYCRESGEYVFLAESIDEQTGKWTTVGTAIPDLDVRINPADVTVLFDDDEACPFPYQGSDALYLFTSRCTESHPSGEVNAAWEGVIRVYDQ